jgi:hypothetical protein
VTSKREYRNEKMAERSGYHVESKLFISEMIMMPAYKYKYVTAAASCRTVALMVLGQFTDICGL